MALSKPGGAATATRPVPSIPGPGRMPRRPARALLRSGVPAVLTPLGPVDAADLLALHEQLSERDSYLRFATVHPAGLDGYITRTLDPATAALTLGARVRGRLVGAVQLLPSGGDLAEVAAVVDAQARHEGVATLLLEELAGRALRLGIHRLQAYVLAENGPMLRVLADLGMPLERASEGSGICLEVVLDPGERYRRASEDRYREAVAASLAPVFRPGSIVVVGAGRGEHSVGRSVLRSLRRAGFPGQVSAVNPGADEIEGFRCHRSVRDVPGPPDLAVIAVPAATVAGVVEELGEAGARALLVLSGGFPDVPGLAARVRTLTDRYGMRMVGPNSVGVASPGEPFRLDATFAGTTPPAGGVGLVAQSGGVVIAAATGWQRVGLGLSSLAAIGDAHDVGARDVLAWFDEDPDTRLAVLYAESEPDLRGLAATAAHLARRMPVLALEAGTSAAGARAAASHTARAATPSVIREAAYVGAGIQSVPDLSTLNAAVALLSGQALPGPGTVAVLTNVGGGGVLTADACVSEGLPVEPLPADLQERLRRVLPPLASTVNPVDTGAAVSADAFAAALRCLLEDTRVAAVITVTSPTGVSDPAPGVALAVRAAGARVPVIDVRFAGDGTLQRILLPDDRFVPSVTEPAVAARALGVAWRRKAWLARPEGAVVPPSGVDVLVARTVVAGVLDRAPDGDWLLPQEVGRLCEAAVLPAVPTAWATTAAEAHAAAARLRGPTVVKGLVRGVVHKADAGLLRLPVPDPSEVADIVGEWARRYGTDWLGAVVQPLAPGGDELLVGAVRDAAAGAVVALGAGGRAADALGHRVHRLAPLSDVDVTEMLVGTGLFGTSHGRTLATGAVGDCLQRVGWLADALPEIEEIDVNPLIVTADAALALDVRVRIAPVRD